MNQARAETELRHVPAANESRITNLYPSTHSTNPRTTSSTTTTNLVRANPSRNHDRDFEWEGVTDETDDWNGDVSRF